MVNRPPVKRFNRGPGTEMPSRASLCRVVWPVPGGTRYAGPRWCSPGYYAIFTGASPVLSCYTVVALQSQTDSDTFVRANGSRPAVTDLDSPTHRALTVSVACCRVTVSTTCRAGET